MDPLKIHPVFLAKKATAIQRKLYTKRFQGVSSKEKDEEKADAILIIAVAQVIHEGNYREVPILVPESWKSWVSSRIVCMAKTCTSTLRLDSRKKATLPIARKLLESIKPMTPNIGQILTSPEPPCWVAIGYTRDELLPTWLVERLL